MSAGIPRPSTTENVATTLSSGITDSAGTMTVADASKIVSPCYLMIDRVDSSGTLKATSLWELVKVTNVSGSDLTVTRGQNGTTQQAHSSGAVVEAVVSSAMFEEWYAVLDTEHDAAGGHVITGTMTIAGMNLASQATIRYGSIGILGVQSVATINSAFVSTMTVTTLLNVGSASVVGWSATGRTLRQVIEAGQGRTGGGGLALATTTSASLISVPSSAASINSSHGSHLILHGSIGFAHADTAGKRITTRINVDGTGQIMTLTDTAPGKIDTEGSAGMNSTYYLMQSVASGPHVAYWEYASPDGGVAAVNLRKIMIEEYL